MPIIAENNGSDFNKILPPSGNHLAICVRMIHLGTLEVEWQGQKKKQNKVRLYFELSHEQAVFDEHKGPENFIVSKEYTLSMHEKSNLRKDLESWRGKAFTDDQAEAFDITVLLNVPCMLNVIIKKHESSGNEYALIAGISQLPKGMEKPVAVNTPFEFSVLEFDRAKFDTLSEFLREKIESSDEYKKMIRPDNGQVLTKEDFVSDDDLPF